MKTVAIIINTSWNVYNFRLGLLNAIKEQGFRVVIIAPKDNYSRILQDMGFDYHNVRIDNKGTSPINDLLLIKDFYQLFRKIKPDIVLQYTIKPNIYGTLAAKLSKTKVINNISGLGTVFLNDNLSSKLARFLYRLSLRFAKKVFFQNPHDRNLFIQNKLVKESLTGLLPGSGINVEKFRATRVEKNKVFSFLLVARLIKDKGLEEYIEAARIVLKGNEKVKFQLLGDLYLANPTAISQVELETWQKEGVIEYLGHVDDVAAVINKCDCVVLPSYREGLSRVLLEAAAMSKPIITTNVPGCKDVVDDGVNGFLCKVKNHQDLAKNIHKMLALTNEERNEMGKMSRLKVENEFDEKIVIKKYLEVISKVI